MFFKCLFNPFLKSLKKIFKYTLVKLLDILEEAL